ncbi:DUF2955 domain-containing protein [Shimia marina]|uniref:DUF2955 domain-containing protein n=1 Tax=Shimia marina TaxID=321267 RepID=A0A0P1EM10_9RHOB|nr:DUF2955 domain-containing protein [Shimia marina]CUH51320.1 hypothetical protein SHM7688_00755 [Shimia marina]SFD52152.1 Protein of unknown function [Shimia marina]
MPTEATSAPDNRGLRLAVGVGGHFALAILLGWPLATICTVFVTLFLQAPGPMPPKAIKGLFMMAVVFLTASWVISSALSPYPVAFLLGLALAVASAFYWSTKGTGMLAVVLALMAALMLPTLVLTSQKLALILVIWVPLNLVLAWLWTVAMFHLFPPTPSGVAAAQKPPAPHHDPSRLVWRMSLVTIPFAFYFYLVGSGALVTLLFVAILSQQLSAATAAGPTVARGMLKANVLGGIAAMICYELTVIAPLMLVALLAFATAAFVFARWFVSGRADASLAGSGLTTTVILFGGSIAPFGDDADVALVDRLLQIGNALMFVLIAYVVVDAFFPLTPDPKAKTKRRPRARLRRRTAPS